jgi:hypothetical protein
LILYFENCADFTKVPCLNSSAASAPATCLIRGTPANLVLTKEKRLWKPAFSKPRTEETLVAALKIQALFPAALAREQSS